MHITTLPIQTRRPVFAGQSPPLTRDERIDQLLDQTDTPAFQHAIQDTYDRARIYLEAQLKAGNKGFVLLDIDETVLDNRGFFRDPGRQYYKASTTRPLLKQTWNQWVGTSTIPVIPAAKQFINWLNQNQVPYCFLTGIQDTLQTPSVANLQAVGVIGPSCLGTVYRPVTWKGPVKDFKIQQRQQLEKQFAMPILATIGDRQQDMTGDSQKDFLLPNYVEALRKDADPQ